MKIDPHGPTIDSSTAAMDGWLTPASSLCGMTPYDTSVTSAKTLSTLRNPMTVARPTSSRLIIEPTTIAVSVGRLTFSFACSVRGSVEVIGQPGPQW